MIIRNIIGEKFLIYSKIVTGTTFSSREEREQIIEVCTDFFLKRKNISGEKVDDEITLLQLPIQYEILKNIQVVNKGKKGTIEGEKIINSTEMLLFLN